MGGDRWYNNSERDGLHLRHFNDLHRSNWIEWISTVLLQAFQSGFWDLTINAGLSQTAEVSETSQREVLLRWGVTSEQEGAYFFTEVAVTNKSKVSTAQLNSESWMKWIDWWVFAVLLMSQNSRLPVIINCTCSTICCTDTLRWRRVLMYVCVGGCMCSHASLMTTKHDLRRLQSISRSYFLQLTLTECRHYCSP